MMKKIENRKHGATGEVIRTVFYAVVIALVIRTFAFEPFVIPSRSMVPTLLVGDYLFVSKYSYGYSRYSFPFSIFPFSGRILKREPERGDVVVFRPPNNPNEDYIKRVVGLPGDRIQMIDGILNINGQPVKRERAPDYTLTDESGNFVRATQYMETLPGGYVHPILELQGDTDQYDNTQVFVVPPDHYFMMGDNRDDSSDSRASVGYVPAENLIGRAEVLFFSQNGSSSWWEVWKWPSVIRWDRLFSAIR